MSKISIFIVVLDILNLIFEIYLKFAFWSL
jgi:hypothetical protein